MIFEQLHPTDLSELVYHGKDAVIRSRALNMLHRRGAGYIGADGRVNRGYVPDDSSGIAARQKNPGYYEFLHSLMS